MFPLNTSVNESTKFNPAEIFLGRKLKTQFQAQREADLPEFVKSTIRQTKRASDSLSEIRENIKKAQARSEKYYNKNRRQVSFNVKDLVLVRNFPQSSKPKNIVAKFCPK